MNRAALQNRDLVLLFMSHLAGIVADKAAYIALLVYVFQKSGPSATAAASVSIGAPILLMTPLVARLLSGRRPNLVRWVALWVQALCIAAAAGVVAADGSPLLAVVACTTGVAATTVQRPAVAVLSPALARRPEDLVAFNVWIAYLSAVASVAASALVAIGLSVGSVSLAFALSGAVALLAAGTATTLRHFELAPVGSRRSSLRTLVAAVGEVRGRPGSWAIMLVATMHYAIIMSLPVFAVLLAEDVLGLGPEGPGTLALYAGVGSLVAAAAMTPLMKRQRLAWVIVGALMLGAGAHAVLGVVDSRALVAFVALGAVGACRVALDGVSRIMLQRATSPEVLGGVFALLQAATGIGGLIGAGLVHALVWVGGVELALWGTAAWFTSTAVLVVGPLLRADRVAHVPVVEVTLLRRVPQLSSVRASALESMARFGRYEQFSSGDTIVSEGDEGEQFFAIAEGACRVDVGGCFVRDLGVGDGFGEVALLAGGKRTASITATTDVTALTLDREAFLTAITGSADAHREAWAHMSRLHFADGASPFGGRSQP